MQQQLGREQRFAGSGDGGAGGIFRHILGLQTACPDENGEEKKRRLTGLHCVAAVCGWSCSSCVRCSMSLSQAAETLALAGATGGLRPL